MRCPFFWAALLSALTPRVADAVLVKQPAVQAATDASVPASSQSMETSGVVPTAQALVSASQSGVPTPGVVELPTGKRIAVIFRGETFRYNYWDEALVKHRKSCAAEAVDLQVNCTKSIVERIIEPLERKGNRVEVLFSSVAPLRTRMPSLLERSNASTASLDDHTAVTNETRCPYDALLVQALEAPRRVVTNLGQLQTTGQADTMHTVLEALNNQYQGEAAVSSRFDHIIIVRNDLYWFQPLDEIHASFDKLNALSQCEPEMPECIHDSVYMVPGSLYGVLGVCFGVPGCFRIREDPYGVGHFCKKCFTNLAGQLGGELGYLEPGLRRVRGAANVAHPGLPNGHVADLTDIHA